MTSDRFPREPLPTPMQESPPSEGGGFGLHWDDLRVFVAVATAGSFSRAARRLGVEHSTLSRRIKRLEETLGLTLFERHPGGLRPTGAAEPLLLHALEAAENIEALVRAAHAQTSAGGRVQVACVAALAELLLMPALPEFLAANPALRIDLETGLDFVDVARGRVDIALRSRRAEDHGLVSRKLASLRFAAFATESYAERIRGLEPLAWDWIIVRADVLETNWFAAHVGVEPRLTTFSFQEQLEAVRRGLGVGLVTEAAASLYPELVALPLPGYPPPPPFELWLVSQQERSRQPHVRAVIDWIVGLTTRLSPPT